MIRLIMVYVHCRMQCGYKMNKRRIHVKETWYHSFLVSALQVGDDSDSWDTRSRQVRPTVNWFTSLRGFLVCGWVGEPRQSSVDPTSETKSWAGRHQGSWSLKSREPEKSRLQRGTLPIASEAPQQVFTWALLSMCTWRNYPRSERQPCQRISSSIGQYSPSIANSTYSHQPLGKKPSWFIGYRVEYW